MPKIVLKGGSRPPWVGLAAAVWVLIAAANSSNFPLFSSALKSVLDLNQQQVTILGVANDIGENMSLLPGLACNKFPPWALVMVGSVLLFLGYGVLWLAVSQIVSGLPYVLIWVALCLGASGGAWLGTSVLVTNMRNFPLSRGTVSGIIKAYEGISASVYTLIFYLALKKSAVRLLFFLAVVLPGVSLALMYFIRACTPPSGEDSSVHVHFIFTQVATVVLAVYLLAANVLNDIVSISVTVSYILLAIMVILLLIPLAIPVKMTLFPTNQKKNGSHEGTSSQSLLSGDDLPAVDPSLTPTSSARSVGSFHESEYASDVPLLLAEGQGAVRTKRKPRRGEDFNLREAVIKADFWLLWFAFFLGVGTGVTVLNNLAQIGYALGLEDTTILLAVFSFCNFVGRLGAGAVSEHFVSSRTLPRTFWMMCAHIIAIVAFVLYALALDSTLYAATALLGVCYGVQNTILVPTVSELFGLKHIGVIGSVVVIGNPIGAILFSVLLASSVYDAEAAKQGSSSCYGPDCFRLTFFVLAGACGLGTILSIILTVRILPVYRMLYAGGSFRLPETSNQ